MPETTEKITVLEPKKPYQQRQMERLRRLLELGIEMNQRVMTMLELVKETIPVPTPVKVAQPAKLLNMPQRNAKIYIN